MEPHLPICDAHHHLWDGPGDRGQYLVGDFLRDAAGMGITKTVFVECGTKYRKGGPKAMEPVGETEFVRAITADCAGHEHGAVNVAAGIAGFVDLTLGGDAAHPMEAHIASGMGRFRSVRQSCTWDPDQSIVSLAKRSGMMGGAKFREGFACLERYGLAFDAWQYYTQLLELADLARAFPRVTIVVNHTGGPLGIGLHARKGQEMFEEWKQGVGELATCANVAMKLGGLGMPRCGFGWHERREPPGSTELAEAMAPYLRFCISEFGAERCMFESNFPVDRVSYPYGVLWNAFKIVCGDYSEEERSALLYGTAARVYCLQDGEEVRPKGPHETDWVRNSRG